MKSYRVALFGLALGCTLLPIALAELSKEEISEATKLLSSPNTDDHLRGVETLGRGDSKKTVEILVKVLANDKYDSRVHDAAIEALGKTTDEEAIDALIKAGGSGNWEYRARIIAALVKTGSEKAQTALVKNAEGKDPLVQTVAIDALGEMKAASAIPAIAGILDKKSTPWQVKIAAIQALAKIHQNDCVDPLIKAYEEEPEGRVREEIEDALQSLTGKSMPNAGVWKSWWNANRSRPLEGPGFEASRRDPNPRGAANGGQNGAGGDEGSSAIPTYYGEKIRSKRLVFVIDISGSMSEDLGRKPQIGPVASGAPGQPNQPQVDYSKVKTKLDLAKLELVKAIRMLPKDAFFNVIFYNHDVTIWKDQGLLQASDPNKADAIKRVEGLSPDGLTNIHGGLEKAFSLDSKTPMGGEKAGQEVVVSGADYQRGPDTIYFLTDGWPTAGKELNGITPQNGGGNVDAYRTELLKVVGEWLQVRKIKINTVGISQDPGGHDQVLMRELASMSGGTYVAP